MTVSRVVIPAAGWGTRFLPATKAVPKEMLPVIDRPVIEYGVAEAVAAGITEVVIVVSDDKEAIERHFTPAPALEAALEAAGKTDLLEQVHRAASMASIDYIVQAEQLGLGHAVATAEPLVGEGPFAVLLPDEVITSGLLGTMLDVFAQRQASVIGLMEVEGPEISAYGVPEIEDVEPGLVQVRSIVEKPAYEDAPSAYATIGRYVFTPEILEALQHIEPGVGGEIQLTDAIDLLARDQGVYGSVLTSGRWDVGQVPGMLRAGIELALERDDLRDTVRTMIGDIARQRGLT